MDEADISHKRRRIYTPAEVAQHNYKGVRAAGWRWFGLHWG